MFGEHEPIGTSADVSRTMRCLVSTAGRSNLSYGSRTVEVRRLLLFLLGVGLVAGGCSTEFQVGPRATGLDPDASTSDASASDGGAVFSCSSVDADLCADFETARVGEEDGWISQAAGGTIELDQRHGRYSARSALFQVPSGADGVSLLRILTRVRGLTTIDFDAFVAKPTSGAAPLLGLLELSFGSRTTPAVARIQVSVGPTAVTLRVHTSSDRVKASTKPLSGYDRWVHVKLAVDWARRSASVDLDGEQVVADDVPSTVPLSDLVATAIGLGAIVWNQPAPNVAANLDNIVVTGH